MLGIDGRVCGIRLTTPWRRSSGLPLRLAAGRGFWRATTLVTMTLSEVAYFWLLYQVEVV